ncbi:MAG: hypothetical protein ACLUOF_07475 [Ruminococcus sp.]
MTNSGGLQFPQLTLAHQAHAEDHHNVEDQRTDQNHTHEKSASFA